MIVQIFIGSALILLTILLGTLGLYLLETGLRQGRGWLVDQPHWPKRFMVALGCSLWALAMLGVCVWIWAGTFMALGIFATWETSVYFALESFTTLGFGDVVAPPQWRILTGMAAANGLLNFGLLTAVLVECLRELRVRQARRMHRAAAARR